MPMRAKPLQRAIRVILNPLAVMINALRPLRGRCDGNVALLFALAAIPVMIGGGIAIDTTRAYMVKTRLGAALDAAALAVGSKANQTTAQLTAELQNYFYDNYCKGVPSGATVTACSDTVAGETNISVQAVGSITAQTVSYQAQATVPMTFMLLVGVPNITIDVTAQTTKFPGMEIAVVLDNTGSMLCGPNDGAPSYSDALCAQNVVAADTTCTDGTNQGRICTLINASKQFVTTLQNAITEP
jgi:Flp pilus assembly protein TadG